MRHLLLMTLSLLLALATACGDDGGMTGDDPTLDSGMEVMCSMADQTEIASDIDGYRATASACGLECALSADPSVCTAACIVREDNMNGAISEECASCYGDSVACTADNCRNECAAPPIGMGSPSDPACIMCQCTNNCIQAFSTCSGIPSTLCGGGSDGGA